MEAGTGEYVIRNTELTVYGIIVVSCMGLLWYVITIASHMQACSCIDNNLN